MKEHLPGDVTEQILANLPIISVLRFRSVCKTWQNIIDNPRFAYKGESGSTFIFLRPPVYNEVETHLVKSESYNPSSLRLNSRRMNVCSCPKGVVSTIHYANGLFCFSSKRTCYINSEHIDFFCPQIFNPAIGVSVDLPEIRAPVASGFGFSSSTAEYKVVYLFDSGAEAEVFTLGSTCWRKLEGAPDVRYLIDSSCASVNGSLHWLTERGYVLTFNIASEQFGKIAYPVLGLFDFGAYDCRIINIDGDLWITSISLSDSNDIELWTLKKYNVNASWRKVTVHSRYRNTGNKLRPVSFWKKGELLLLESSNELLSLNLATGSYTRPQVNGFGYPSDVFPYAGNLLSPKTAGLQAAVV